MYYFIVNPASRSGKGASTWKIIEEYLLRKNIPYKIYMTKYQYHARKIAWKIAKTDEKLTLITVGGDGTINEVINGIANSPNVTLGCIPTGSGNDFIRETSFAKDPVKALEYILEAAGSRTIDTGILKYKKKQKNFGVSMGIGFDAMICFQAFQSSLKHILNKIKLGKLTYIGIALKLLLLYKPTPLKVRVDHGDTTEYKKCYFLTVMNKKYEGGGLKLSPNADDTDGYLDVCIVDSLPKAKIFLVFPTAYFGKHLIFKGVHSFKCKSIDIESEHPLPVHADGEICGYQTSLSINISPDSLKIVQ